MSLWWHVYGGEIPDMAIDDDGNPAAAWAHITFGESTLPPERVTRKFIDYGGEVLPYLASFDHEPTEGELEQLKPEEYAA